MAEHDADEQVHEIHEKAEGATGWLKYAALSAALLAAIAAISSNVADSKLTKAMIGRLEANDQWSFYQSKSLKYHLADLETRLHANAGNAQGQGAAAEAAGQYTTDMEVIKAKAEAAQKDSERDLECHEVMDRGVTCFHIAIAIVAICLLTRRRRFFLLSLALGAGGLAFFVRGLLM